MTGAVVCYGGKIGVKISEGEGGKAARCVYVVMLHHIYGIPRQNKTLFLGYNRHRDVHLGLPPVGTQSTRQRNRSSTPTTAAPTPRFS